MNINFAMWRKASWELIKMDDKKEWDALDVVSKWLIATRSAVTTVTIYSCIIAGFLAWRYDYFSWLPWIIITLGLFIAHGTNNLLNDYTDFSRGVDKDNYFRTQYGVHPLVQKFWTKENQIKWFVVSGVLATLSGVFALFYTNFNPFIIGAFAFGALVLLFYTWPFKYWGIGELSIFLIWGPIMIGSVYVVLALGNGGDMSNLFKVALAGIPFGLSVASINIGKHIDKMEDDKKKGVGTFPVRVGQTFARYTNIASILVAYGVIILSRSHGIFLHADAARLFSLHSAPCMPWPCYPSRAPMPPPKVLKPSGRPGSPVSASITIACLAGFSFLVFFSIQWPANIRRFIRTKSTSTCLARLLWALGWPTQ